MAAGAAAVDISNLGLFAIGHSKPIAALTEKSDQARACARLYPQSLDEVLESFPWPMAMRRARPAQLDPTTLDLGAVPDGWAFAYALPADCVPNGLRKVYPGTRNPRVDQETPHAIEFDGKTNQVIVLTDDDSPEFMYTARPPDSTRFSASFVRAVADALAVELIPALRKDLKLVPTQMQKAALSLAKAQSAAKRGEMPDQVPPPSWIANR